MKNMTKKQQRMSAGRRTAAVVGVIGAAAAIAAVARRTRSDATDSLHGTPAGGSFRG